MFGDSHQKADCKSQNVDWISSWKASSSLLRKTDRRASLRSHSPPERLTKSHRACTWHQPWYCCVVPVDADNRCWILCTFCWIRVRSKGNISIPLSAKPRQDISLAINTIMEIKIPDIIGVDGIQLVIIIGGILLLLLDTTGSAMIYYIAIMAPNFKKSDRNLKPIKRNDKVIKVVQSSLPSKQFFRD